MSMRKKLRQILRQYNLGLHVGGIKQILLQTVFYVSIINFLLIAMTAYNTTLRAHILVALPWFKLWMFIMGLAVLVGIAMVIEYKVIYPSYIAFQNKQEYEHQNLLRVDLAKVLEQLERIEKALGLKDED